MIELDVKKWKEYYAEFGYCSIPLKPGTKLPLEGISWKNESNEELWNMAPDNANIGFRCGGRINLLVIDCDEKKSPGTFTNVSLYLAGLGITNFPLIQTSSGIGRHIYIECINPPKGDYKQLSHQFGIGEVRHSDGCYVVAPPSKLNMGGAYQLLSGSFHFLPSIKNQDVLPLLSNQIYYEDRPPQTFHKIPRNVWQLLNGSVVDKFPSRSEADQSIITTLINCGFDYQRIKNIFMLYPTSGKFKELYEKNPNKGLNYLELSYQEGCIWCKNNTSKGRQIAQFALNWAVSRPWPGRTGAYDQAVYKAHAQTAQSSGKIIYQASCRELAELSGMSSEGANNATKRLCKQGLIKLENRSLANFANRYSLGQSFTLPQPRLVRECPTLSNHDVFRFLGLGKSSYQIWTALQDGPKSINELNVLTSRSKRTIKRRLEKMSSLKDLRTGEIVSMVHFDGERYFMNEGIDLNYISELLGTKGMRDKQIKKHQREREIHNEALLRLRKK